MFTTRSDLPAPGDLARWLFWVRLRESLPADRPELLRRLWPLWRAQYLAATANHALLREELERCFGRNDESILKDAYRLAFRSHFQELLLGKMTRDNIHLHMRFENQQHLDAALARGKGAIILCPHAGNVMMMIAKVALSGYTYTQYAARGLAPPEVAALHPELFGHNRWRREAREVREAAEDQLPASFLTMETPVRELLRRLGRNEVVGIAYDGRLGKKFVPAEYLGRKALLNPGPYKMACTSGAAIVPTFCYAPNDGPEICHFGEPIFPKGRSAETVMAQFLHAAAEPFLRAHPESYAIWLLHCRLRAAVDDHPFFVDYAPDERWRKWES